MTDKARELIFLYFQEEIEDLKLNNSAKKELVNFFEIAAEKNLSLKSIGKQLNGSSIRDIRKNIIAKNINKNKPYPIRLGGLKSMLQCEATNSNYHLTTYILLILRNRKPNQ